MFDTMDVMVEEDDEDENVTTYVLMSLLNKSGSQDTGAYKEEFNFVHEDTEDARTLDSGENFYHEQ